ncbi:MAG: ribulose-phosphate 3-epimerase [Bacteroidota bacterium]|jgi:ribulose-phosphate 3-epimerase
MEISASLLAADYSRLGDEMQRAESAGIDSFHFDMMDGHYVPNLAFAPDHLKALRPYSRLPFHVHLELDNPDEVLLSFVPLQADMIIVQWNTLTHPHRTFERIRSQGMKVGMGLTPGDVLENASALFAELDLLLLLGVYPGFGGQAIQPETQMRIATAKRLVSQIQKEIPIAVDGGVKLGNATSLVQAGADLLIMGMALFQSSEMTVVVQEIRESVKLSAQNSHEGT